ncbi:MAG: hypothetical protein P8X68_14855 [Desulfobacterales bacterium]
MRAIVLILVIIIPLQAMGDDLSMPTTIQEVKHQHEAEFFKLAGVVSVGIGLDSNGDQAIIVGLERSDPETESKIPASVEGYPVVVKIVGAIKAQD